MIFLTSWFTLASKVRDCIAGVLGALFVVSLVYFWSVNISIYVFCDA